uniref:Putative secreted protein n=1 Tax=Anopheles darlingi TaxID=43151 RepID=A0A2M4DB50_ANODA
MFSAFFTFTGLSISGASTVGFSSLCRPRHFAVIHSFASAQLGGRSEGVMWTRASETSNSFIRSPLGHDPSTS